MQTNTSPEVINQPLSIIDDEIVRERIRRIIGEPKESKLRRVINHPLTAIIVSFVLTFVIGSYLTTRYTAQQKDIERQRSLFDEQNKIRLTKVGEVWERAYLYDSAREKLTEVWWQRYMKETDQTRLDQIEREELNPVRTTVADRERELNDALDRNRFWIGESAYSQIRKYVLISSYYNRSLQGSKAPLHFTGKTTEQLGEEREKLKADLDQLQKDFFGIK